VADVDAAAAELKSAVERLVAEDTSWRLQALQQKASSEPLSAEEKQELQGLIRIKAQSTGPVSAK
jgi:hypothetical protein